jgi:hypothetical protein
MPSSEVRPVVAVVAAFGAALERLRRHAQGIVDRLFPIPDYFVGDWQQQLQRRRDLTSALRLDETSQISIQNALIIGGPLITSALTLLIPAH